MMARRQEVALFVLRHGEREDEAMRRIVSIQQNETMNPNPTKRLKTSGHCSPKKDDRKKKKNAKMIENLDRVDPLLTVTGHRQAQESWTELLNAIRGSKVMIFSSPLRRAMGTAMMIGGAVSSSDGDTVWSRPEPDGCCVPSSENDTTCDGEIPITVMNGLGNFASAVYRKGGVDEVFVPSASLPCADMVQNDGSLNSPLVQALLSMPSHEVKPTGKAPMKVRFWGKAALSSKKKNGTCASYRPISPSFHPANKRYQKEATTTHKIPHYPSTPPKKDFVAPMDPICSIEQAVRETAAAGCDVCIVVVHREAIHELSMHKCGVNFNLSTPYCSVGCYGCATLELCGQRGQSQSQNHQKVRFSLSDVWFSDRQPKTSLHLPIAPPVNYKYSRLMYRHHNDQHFSTLCDVDFTNLRNGTRLGSQIWLTVYKSVHFQYSPQAPFFQIQVVDDQEKERWKHFLRRHVNQDEVVVGETLWLTDNGHTYPVVIFNSPSSMRSMEFAIYQV